MDGKQLKNSILQWAIQGKLVPQNPKDEPAQKLLERIAASRNEYSAVSACHPERSAKGTKSKDLKKKTSKNPPSRIYRENGVWYEQVGSATPKDISDEIPFEIPENWAWCRLDNLGTFVRGNGIKRDETVSTGKPCVRYGEMYTTYRVKFSDIKSHTTSNIFDKCQKFHKDDILMALTGENKWDIALAAVYQGDQEVALGGDMCKFSPFESNSLYLVYLINSPYGIGYKRETSTGDIIVHTSVGKLGNFLIPLPPLAEQKRIVAKLEQVLPLAEEYGAAQEQLDKLNKELPEALKKSILQEAIQGKLAPQNPKDEPASKLLEKIALSRHSERSEESSKGSKKASLRGAKATKQSKNASSRIYRENGVWYEQIGTATPKDISDEIPFEIPENWVWCRLEKIVSINGGFAFKSGNYVEQGKGVRVLRISDFNENGFVNTKKVYHPYDESLADYRLSENDIVMCMTGGTVGKTMYVTVLPEPMLVNQRVADISIIGDIESKYVYQVMSSNVVQDIVLNSKNSTNDNISMELIKNFLIPLPPLAEQKRIVAKLEQLFKVL